MKQLKYSRQRESIKACLMARHDHPTADAIYASIREEFPNISLGTVYRNLNLLVELGEIQKLRCGDGADHFDADTRPHYHFMCRECGCIEDLPMEISQEINDLAQEHVHGKIDSHITYFYGVCENCMKKKTS
ncbi:transcriptional repressor [Lachnoclostridium sp. An14]|uniref:Fur family transcriptional regulator n=1 Tax=Lachnoclostridium sp. An14 TaxID=1965562 RepID=UPI000B39066D|nr:transcriptional repressor [Lachnoclostridium sp. An14]OUQ17187.1 transcriptional repressor [Lachnoclostridium sp. An14]